MIIHGKGEEEYCVDIVKDIAINYEEERDKYTTKVFNRMMELNTWGKISGSSNHLMDIYIIEPLQFRVVKDFKGVVDNPSILM